MTAAAPTSAVAAGLATVTPSGTVLDTWYPAPELGEVTETGTTRLQGADVPEDLASLVGADDARGVDVVAVRTTIASLEDAPTDAHDVYLRLHLLSHRLVAPHGVNLDGQFRCGGSQVYLDWVLRLLGLREGGPVPWTGDDLSPFEVRVAESPEEMEAFLAEKRQERDGKPAHRI